MNTSCPNCNNELSGNAAFCSQCGEPVTRRLRYAGFWRRVAAVVIDLALFWVALVTLASLFGINPVTADRAVFDELRSNDISDAERMQLQIQFMMQFGYFMA